MAIHSWLHELPLGNTLGVDQPFVGRQIGVSTSPMVSSIYNMGVWDKGAAAWVHVMVPLTFTGEAEARRCYHQTGHNLANGKCSHTSRWTSAWFSFAALLYGCWLLSSGLY